MRILSAQLHAVLPDRVLVKHPLEDLFSAPRRFDRQSEVILINSISEAKQPALAIGVNPVITHGDPPQNLLIATETTRLISKERGSL